MGILTVATISPSFPALYVGNSWRDDTGSTVVGHECSGVYPSGEQTNLKRWRIAKYAFTLPAKTEENEAVVSILSLQFKFNSSYYSLQQGTIQNVSYVISPEPRIYTNDRLEAKTHVIKNATGEGGERITPIIQPIENTGLKAYNSSGQKVSFSLRPGGTYYLYVIANTEPTASNGTGVFGWQYWSSSAITVDVEYQTTTKCSLPEYEALLYNDEHVSTYIPPQADLIFAFSSEAGALDGINNEFVGFNLFYKLEGDNSWNSYYYSKNDCTTIQNTGSMVTYLLNFKLELNEKDRARQIYFKHQTVGAESGFNSDESNPLWYIINNRPLINDVTTDKPRIPSAGGDITFTVSMTDSSYISGGRRIEYKAPSMDWQQIELSNSQSTKTITAKGAKAGNYQFKIFDGLEYSKDFTVSLAINQPPLAEPTLVLQAAESTAYLNEDAPYCYSFKDIAINETQGDNVTWQLYLCEDGNSPIFMTEIDTKETYDISDIRNLPFLPKETERVYWFAIKGSDEVEETGFIPVKYDDENYKVSLSPIPQFQFYNLPNRSILTYAGKSELYFDNVIGLLGEYDSGYSYATLSLKQAGAKSFSSLGRVSFNTTSTGTKKLYADYNLSSKLLELRGESVEYMYYLYSQTGDQIARISANQPTMFRIKTLSLSNLISQNTVLKPFTIESCLLSLTNFLPALESNPEQYGLQLWMSNKAFKINPYAGKTCDTINVSDLEFMGDTIQLFLKGEDLWNSVKDRLEYDKTYSGYFKLSLTNDFGNATSINSQTVSFDFKEQPTIKVFNIKANGKNIQDSLGLKEGAQLYADLEITSYNGGPVGQIYISRETESGIWSDFEEYGHKLIFVKKDETEILGYGMPITYVCNSQSFYEIGEITRQKYKVSFKIVITSNGLSRELDYAEGKNVLAFGHKNGTISLIDAQYHSDNGSSYIDVQYSYNDLGFDSDMNGYVTTSYAFEVNDDSDDKLKDIEFITDSLAKVNYKFEEEKEIVSGRIKVTTIFVLEGAASEKTFYSNLIPIYNILPTIAYRKNHIGINHNKFSDNNQHDVLVISQYGPRKYIRLKGENNEILLDLSEGTISGFILDGGTWGDTT